MDLKFYDKLNLIVNVVFINAFNHSNHRGNSRNFMFREKFKSDKIICDKNGFDNWKIKKDGNIKDRSGFNRATIDDDYIRDRKGYIKMQLSSDIIKYVYDNKKGEAKGLSYGYLIFAHF